MQNGLYGILVCERGAGHAHFVGIFHSADGKPAAARCHFSRHRSGPPTKGTSTSSLVLSPKHKSRYTSARRAAVSATARSTRTESMPPCSFHEGSRGAKRNEKPHAHATSGV